MAPGNAGTASRSAGCATSMSPPPTSPAWCAWRSASRWQLTIIGPETPLVMGVVDAFEAAGLRCFGPSRAAAQLEGSKAYCKEFLERHRIPTAAYRTFRREDFDADWLRAQSPPIVIKASGLAAGKGVVIAAEHRGSAGHGRGHVLQEATATRARRWSSRNSSRARKPVSSCSPTARTPCPAPARRTTSAWAMGTSGPTPAAWAPTRPLRW